MSNPTAAQKKTGRILAEHQELRSLLRHLDHFTQEPRPEIGQEGFHRWASGLSRNLVDLHDMLYRHFTYESGSGLFDDLKLAHPRAEKIIDELEAQHPHLLQEVRDLVHASLGYSQGEAPANPRLRKRLAETLQQLREHEEREGELMIKLNAWDIGNVD